VVVAGFRRARKGGVAVTFGADDERWLRHVLGEMLELLEPPDGADSVGGAEDPLAAAVGIGTSTTAPEDPALARLFPDGYTEDPEASADFRRHTEPGLRAAKRAALQTALSTLSSDPVVLDEEEAESWLRALNDTRLVLGERLGVTEELDELLDSLAAGDPEDPRLAMFWVYDRLTYLEESLVQALSGGS